MAKSKEDKQDEKVITRRWELKRDSIYRMKENIDRLKRHIRNHLLSSNEKDRLTALVIRIMLYTSERIGNEESASQGHFGVTQFKNKHVSVEGNRVILDYVGKSGVQQEKSFVDETSALLLDSLKLRKNKFVFTTKDGFRINPDRVNRYLKNYDAKSKDIRGFNANRLMVMELNRIGETEEKKRPRVFNLALRKIGGKVGHGAPTLRKHYLLPEIEETFYNRGCMGDMTF